MSFQPTALNLPVCKLKIIQKGKQYFVFDEVRKKYLLLTAEEWVRQHFIHFLIQHKKVPKALLSAENGLVLNTQSLRTDILVFNRHGAALLIVECKAPKVPLNQKVMDQIVRYNMNTNCKWLAITNGLQHIYAKVENGGIEYFQELPAYDFL